MHSPAASGKNISTAKSFSFRCYHGKVTLCTLFQEKNRKRRDSLPAVMMKMMAIVARLLTLTSLVSGFQLRKFHTAVGRCCSSRSPISETGLRRDSLRLPLSLSATSSEDNSSEADASFDLAAWFNPNTRGGVLVWSALLLIIPTAIYNYFVSTGMEDTKVGANVGFAFVVLSMVGWASTYLFRVANKDMTYARQLKDYENAVLQKRLEELQDDEIQALMEEIDLEDSGMNEPSEGDE